MTVMNQFLTEFVGVPEDRCLLVSSPVMVRNILEGLWVICSEEAPETGCCWTPRGEFRFRSRLPLSPSDRVFRVREFEGRSTVARKRTFKGKESRETDASGRTDNEGPGCGGIDLLGKYCFEDSTVTIYVDSCRKVVGRYHGVNSLDALIKVVLVHELAHLATHRHLLGSSPDASDHFWEYTAQCATYAFLKSADNANPLEVFELLSPHQPFFYQTWEGLRVLDYCNIQNARDMMCKIIRTPPLTRDNSIDTLDY
jgi:hypothetical protein